MCDTNEHFHGQEVLVQDVTLKLIFPVQFAKCGLTWRSQGYDRESTHLTKHTFPPSDITEILAIQNNAKEEKHSNVTADMTTSQRKAIRR